MLHKHMSQGGESMNDASNIIAIRKTDKFFLCKAGLNETGEVVERERVGVAYLKPTSSTFRLKLWMFPKGEFFLAREERRDGEYVALCRDEYEIPFYGPKNQWHKIGFGEVVGNFVRIRMHLLSEDIYLCLFPEVINEAEATDAA
jgi:hypothetical protein